MAQLPSIREAKETSCARGDNICKKDSSNAARRLFLEGCDVATRVTVEIMNETGLHARPAALFVEAAKKFSSAITVWSGQKKANAKSITSLLLLGVNRGTSIDIEADGPDEADAVKALGELVSGLVGK